MTAWRAAAREAPSCELDAWTALLEGRLTLVDWFDEDGRRFVVARRNATPIRISAVERTVVRWVATGRPQKVVACELGMSPAAVSDALARAIHKLGLSRADELPRVAAALLSEYPPPGMKLNWSKGAGDLWTCVVEPFSLRVAPKGDGRWNWQIFKGAANPTASGVASSLGAAKTATEQFVKRSGLV